MARRFRFRLETVRRLRKQALDAQRRVVADAVQALVRVEERIAALTRTWHGMVDQSRDAMRIQRLDLVSLSGHQVYRGWLDQEIAKSNESLARKRAELDAERVRLAETSKELKVIDKLRERQWKRFSVKIAREEQVANDEAALQMYLRRQREQRREAVA